MGLSTDVVDRIHRNRLPPIPIRQIRIRSRTQRLGSRLSRIRQGRLPRIDIPLDSERRAEPV